MAYVMQQSASPPPQTIEWEMEPMWKNNSRKHEYHVLEWVSAIGGTHISLQQPPAFPLSLRDPTKEASCNSDDTSTFRVTEHEVRDVPFDYAIPMLTGWELWFPCGDQHVSEMGVWLYDITYDKQPGDATGILRYKVSSILRDKDSQPGHGAQYQVSILGMGDQRVEQHLHFDDGIVGFLDTTPETSGLIRHTGNASLVITDAVVGGAQVNEFMFDIEYRGEVFLLSDLPQRAPLELLPDETLVVGGRFLPGAAAPDGTDPRAAWVAFQTDNPGSVPIHVRSTGHTIPSQAYGHWFPGILNFGIERINAHPLTSLTRNAVLESVGSTPLFLTHSLRLTDPNAGFRFTVINGPDPLYQIDPGDGVTVQITFDPDVVGDAETTLIAETSEGRKELRLLGFGVAH